MVETRDKESLDKFIKDYVEVGSNTVTDKWKAYDRNHIEEHTGATHCTVNHSTGFSRISIENCHTNTVEGKVLPNK
jgi:hypothetical protein